MQRCAELQMEDVKQQRDLNDVVQQEGQVRQLEVVVESG